MRTHMVHKEEKIPPTGGKHVYFAITGTKLSELWVDLD